MQSQLSKRTLRLVAPVGNSGIGIHASKLTEQLRRLETYRFHIEFVNSGDAHAVESAISASQASDVTVFFMPTDYPKRFGGRKIIWYVFDLTKLAENEEKHLMECYDSIWTPSEWGRQILLQHGLPYSKIQVMPEGVNPDIFSPKDELNNPNRKFRILQVGKFETRKSYQESVAGIHMAFAGRDDVEYVVKCDWMAGYKSIEHPVAISTLQHSGCSTIIVKGNASDAEMAQLYRSADVFLFPSKGEGWGLPAIEALASGVPTIVTCYSGQSEYLKSIPGGYLDVDYVLKPMDCIETQSRFLRKDENWGLWAVPNVEDIAEKLETVYANREQWRKKALHSSRIISETFSWSNCAKRVLDSLQ